MIKEHMMSEEPNPSTDIIPADLGEGAVQKYDESVIDAISAGHKYLPRLQLMIANSGPCKKNKFPINHYALIRDQNMHDLGESIDVIVVAVRPKALDLSGDEVVSVFDPKLDAKNNPTGEFARIQDKAAEKDSQCMFGPEYLMYISSIGQFATFFMGSKSARRESPNLKALLRQAATLKSKLIQTKRYEYFSPAVLPCSTPLDPPNTDDLIEQVNKFNNPPEREVELVEDDAEGPARAR
jgi:hypothetical protein